MKSLCIVRPQCTIVGLKNTVSGTVFFGQQFIWWLCCVFDIHYDFDNFQIKFVSCSLTSFFEMDLKALAKERNNNVF